MEKVFGIWVWTCNALLWCSKLFNVRRIERKKDKIVITKAIFPVSSGKYTYSLEKGGTDYLSIHRFFHLGKSITIVDINKDDFPDYVSITFDDRSYKRGEPSTEKLFERVDTLWKEYKKWLDVNAKVKETLENPLPEPKIDF